MLSSIKSVLVGLTEEGGDEASSALGYGLSLASAAAAYLTVQATSVKLVVPSASISDVAAELVATENGRLRTLAAAVADRARGDAQAAGVTCAADSPHLTYAGLVDAFVGQARVHDLSVLDAEQSPVDIDRGLIEAVLFKSGRPLIIVPPARERFTGRRIMVAWDGSAVAARAVADALPWLRAADAVEVVSVVGEKDIARSVQGAELAPHLARHGVPVAVKILPVSPNGVAETLRSQAGLFRADLMVMGAFRHSRLREWVLGGVTRTLLSDGPLPLFMSH
jgi:nucleotide-binding universal stress UspA family protein